MSYDIYVEGASGDSHNYTYNIAPMLYADGFRWRDYADERAIVVGERLRILIDRMEREPSRFSALNPPNGWGDYYGCLRWLDGIKRDCMEQVSKGHGYDSRVRVW